MIYALVKVKKSAKGETETLAVSYNPNKLMNVLDDKYRHRRKPNLEALITDKQRDCVSVGESDLYTFYIEESKILIVG